jgi:hypothetical protein
MVKEVFDTVFQNCVVKIAETSKTDRNTGKPFKMFWVTLDCGRSSWTLGNFIAEIEKHGYASIIYETTKGQDRWWNVRINKEKEKVKTVPRILERAAEEGEIVEGKRKASGSAGNAAKVHKN